MRNTIIIPTLFTFFLLVTPTHASLKSEFNDLVQTHSLSRDKQSVCIQEGNKKVLSYNADMRIIPASVSKLYTFDFALATLPEDFRYTTSFVLNGSTLYINGGGDPHFVTEHLTSVLQKFSSEKKVHITSIVYTPDFYFNWENTPATVKAALTQTLKTNPTLPVSKTVTITLRTTPYSGTGTSHTFKSAPLPALLKQINNFSTNVSAEVLFTRLGGPAAFSEYMKKTYGVGDETIYFQNGSGLYGNYTTCALTLKVIKHLDETLQKKGMTVTDVLSVPALDPGVIKNRAINTDGKNAIVAKSGFINYNHALAGVINTKKNPAYFGIFTNYDQMTQTGPVKGMVDTYTEALLRYYKKKLVSYNYTPNPAIFTNTLIQ